MTRAMQRPGAAVAACTRSLNCHRASEIFGVIMATNPGILLHPL